MLWWAYIAKGAHDQALADIRKEVEKPGSRTLKKLMLAYACAASGNLEEGSGILWELEPKLEGEARLALLSALVLGALNEKDRAFQQLERAFEIRDPGLLFLKVAPWAEPLRSDPPVRRIGGETGPRLRTPFTRFGFASHSELGELNMKSLRLAGLAAGLAFGLGCGGQQADKAPAGDQEASAGGGSKPVIALIRAADWMGREWSEDAIEVGLRESDMEAGRDYEIKVSSAQGDLATLPSLIDAAVDQKVKVIVTLQDATLQAAVQRAKDVPVVFNLLSDPFAAGAGKSDSRPSPQHHRRVLAGLRRPGADQAGGADQAHRAEGAGDRRAVQPGGGAVGHVQGSDDQGGVGAPGMKVVAVPVSAVTDVERRGAVALRPEGRMPSSSSGTRPTRDSPPSSRWRRNARFRCSRRRPSR